MKKFLIFLIFLMIILNVISEKELKASEGKVDQINSENVILVLFSSDSGEINEQQRLLDLALGHFSENIIFKNVNNVKKEDFQNKSHLVYYGEIKEKLPSKVIQHISSFDGPVMSIGFNIEQFEDEYDFLKVDKETTVEELEYLEVKEKPEDIDPMVILKTSVDDDVEILVRGANKKGKLPVIMRKGNTYYFASPTINQSNSVYFSQTLNSFFNEKTIDKTPAYIRLEDVHPLINPKILMTIAKELKDRNIPYMVAVIPTYIEPKTGKEYHFQDKPEVLKVLKYMQKNGGSMVLHGYTHQFRKTETGEGFEFWDVENQTPIYHGPEEDVKKRTKEDFKTTQEYEKVVSQNKEFERQYIEERLTKGVQELANYGIFPLAFEAPHYAMSQNGYKVTSEFFSTYVGQVQLSDDKWEIMDTTPYVSKPNFLHGMLLLPETIGYVESEKKEAVDRMMEEAKHYQIVEEGMLGGFYHPYLGVENFVELINRMENIPNIDWVDLKEIDNTVTVEHVSITSKNGIVNANIDYLHLLTISWNYFSYHLKKNIAHITELIAIISIIGIFIFFCFIIFQFIKNKKMHRKEE